MYAEAGHAYAAACDAFAAALAIDPLHHGANNNRGNALSEWGDLLAMLGDYAGAQEKYGAALSAYQAVRNPVRRKNNEGTVLGKWGDLLVILSDYAGAEEKYQQALEAYDSVDVPQSYDVGALNNSGVVLAKGSAN